MEDRRMTLLDERSYLDDAKASSRAILGRINARPRTPWPVT
jgi:hypothetical protein